MCQYVLNTIGHSLFVSSGANVKISGLGMSLYGKSQRFSLNTTIRWGKRKQTHEGYHLLVFLSWS